MMIIFNALTQAVSISAVSICKHIALWDAVNAQSVWTRNVAGACRSTCRTSAVMNLANECNGGTALCTLRGV